MTVLYSAMITKYMEEKSKKGEMHRAFKMSTRELCFEIMCRDKGSPRVHVTPQ